MAEALQSAFGFTAILALAWLFSENRGVVAWRTVLAGIALQIVLAAALLKLALFKQFFLALNDTLLALEKATQAGTGFVFGYLGGAALPFTETGAGVEFCARVSRAAAGARDQRAVVAALLLAHPAVDRARNFTRA